MEQVQLSQNQDYQALKEHLEQTVSQEVQAQMVQKVVLAKGDHQDLMDIEEMMAAPVVCLWRYGYKG